MVSAFAVFERVPNVRANGQSRSRVPPRGAAHFAWPGGRLRSIAPIAYPACKDFADPLIGRQRSARPDDRASQSIRHEDRDTLARPVQLLQMQSPVGINVHVKAFRTRKPVCFPARARGRTESANVEPQSDQGRWPPFAKPRAFAALAWLVTTTFGSTEDFAAPQSGVTYFGGPCISSAYTATA
jgi:hypothetical protein